MRIELERSAALAWSPNQVSGASPLFAAGTVEGTMDASFDTSSVLELYRVQEAQGRVEQVARVESAELFTRLAWMHSSTEGASGLLAGAHGNGQLTLWDAGALEQGESAAAALRVTAANHTRSLTALDANPLLKNLLATAAAEELIVWDLAQLEQTPVTHHPTAQHPNFRFPVSDLAWNRCVPRIMATTSTAGPTIIWDMRSQKPVKTLPPDGVPLRSRALAWGPNQATMLATSSEEDSRPVIQLWDLRRAVSPVLDVGTRIHSLIHSHVRSHAFASHVLHATFSGPLITHMHCVFFDSFSLSVVFFVGFSVSSMCHRARISSLCD
jgi:protein transport protein SEC31